METKIHSHQSSSQNNNAITIEYSHTGQKIINIDDFTNMNLIDTDSNSEIDHLLIKTYTEKQIIIECDDTFILNPIANIKLLTLKLHGAQSGEIIRSLINRPIQHLKLILCEIDENFSQNISQLIRKNSTLRKITFMKITWHSELDTYCEIIRAISENQNITKFVFREIYLTNSITVLQILGQSKNLRMLKINIYQRDIQELARYITNNEKLKSLDITDASYQYSGDFENDLIHAISTSGISSLKLRGFVMGEKIIKVIETLLENNMLKILTMDKCKYVKSTNKKLVSGLEKNTSLKYLEITHALIGQDEIIDALQNSTMTTLKLRQLTMNKNNIDVIATLLENDILECLTIDITSCDGNAYEYMYERLMYGLEKNTSLKYLEIISKCNLKTMCKILEKLENKPNLRDIHIQLKYKDEPKINKFINLITNNKSILSVKNYGHYENDAIINLVRENVMENIEHKKIKGKRTKNAYYSVNY